jgi:hypothetical protein
MAKSSRPAVVQFLEQTGGNWEKKKWDFGRQILRPSARKNGHCQP